MKGTQSSGRGSRPAKPPPWRKPFIIPNGPVFSTATPTSSPTALIPCRGLSPRAIMTGIVGASITPYPRHCPTDRHPGTILRWQRDIICGRRRAFATNPSGRPGPYRKVRWRGRTNPGDTGRSVARWGPGITVTPSAASAALAMRPASVRPGAFPYMRELSTLGRWRTSPVKRRATVRGCWLPSARVSLAGQISGADRESVSIGGAASPSMSKGPTGTLASRPSIPPGSADG